MTQKILLIDGNSLIFRAYFASAYGNKKILTTAEGIPTNAVYSFTNMLVHLLKTREYFDVKVAFDKGKQTFRHKKKEDYKAGRMKTPDELLLQLPIARELLDAASIEWFELDDYEADDIIGTIDKYIEKNLPDFDVEILTSDKDMFQLISEKTKILIPNTGTSDLIEFGLEELRQKWFCAPNQVPDLKGLMGDASDNLKGVNGIGEKTAIKLIQEYSSLEGIYKNLENITGATHLKLAKDRDEAFLCRDLATIETDFEISNLNFQKLNISFDKLNEFLIKYEMYSIIKRLGLKVEMNDTESSHKNLEFNILKRWTKEYEAKTNAIFIQTLNDNYHKDKIIGIGISNEKGNFYLDRTPVSVQLSFFEENNFEDFFDQELNDFLKNPQLTKQTYDLKKTLTLLVNLGYEPNFKSFNFDMMVACYALDSNIASTFLNHLTLVSKNYKISADEDIFGKGVKKTGDIDLETKASFIVQKANYIYQCQEKIIKKLEDNNQLDLYEKIDFPFIFVLYSMEQTGVLIDRKELINQTNDVLLKIQKLEKSAQVILQDWVKEDEQFNLSSPKQLQNLLFNDLKLPNLEKGSTGKEVLEKLIQFHPIVNVILEHRKYSKLYSTYLKGFEKYIFEDGRVHTIFNQTLTSTGRLSSIEPNLQNISIRDDEQKQVRKIFIVDKNQEFYSFDYSQIELRVLAQLAPEKKLLKFFEEGRDIHDETARRLYGININETVTSEMRRTAKIFNFGIIYGLSDYGLSKDLNISIPSARNLIQKYYEEFPDLLNFKERTIQYAKENGYVLTDANRKRNIPELDSKNNYQTKQFGERIAINMPIQGTAADLLKVAMINIFNILITKKLATKIVAQIHDEIIFEVPNNEVQLIIPLIKKEMEDAYLKLLKIVKKDQKVKVNLEVSSGHGKNWLELK